MRRIALLLLLALPLACDKAPEKQPAPEPDTVVERPSPSDPSPPFLGVPHDQERFYEDDVPEHDPAFEPRLKGKVTLTKVTEMPYNQLMGLRQQGQVNTEESRGDWVYFAVEAQRPILLPGVGGAPATPAQLSVMERHKAKSPGTK